MDGCFFMVRYQVQYLMTLLVDADELISPEEIATQIRDSLLIKKVFEQFVVTDIKGEYQVLVDGKADEPEMITV